MGAEQRFKGVCQISVKEVAFFTDKSIKIKDVFCGGNFTLAVDLEGRVYSFGDNKYGQLGRKGSSFSTQPELTDNSFS